MHVFTENFGVGLIVGGVRSDVGPKGRLNANANHRKPRVVGVFPRFEDGKNVFFLREETENFRRDEMHAGKCCGVVRARRGRVPTRDTVREIGFNGARAEAGFEPNTCDARLGVERMNQRRGVEGKSDVAVDHPEGFGVELFLKRAERAASAEDDGFV